MIRVHETGLRRGGGHSEQTESSGCGPLPAYGGHGDCRKNPEGFSGKRLQSAVRIICVP